jgi:hypothetical protein
MIAEVVRLAIGLREIAENCGEGRTTVRLECHEGDARAEVVILREDVLCTHLECDLQHALELLAGAHELFRVRGHGLRVEIVARKQTPVA